MTNLEKTLAHITNLFALWTVLGTGWAWWRPGDFTWFIAGEYAGIRLLNIGLGLIMFGMAITLTFDDFRRVFEMPRAILIGVLAQFLIMPALGYLIARGCGLESGLAVGLILVSCCPGGTASNVVTYLAQANLALSVLMTMSSTVVSIVATPMLTGWLAGKYVEVDRANLFINMLVVVLLPLIAGVLFNQFLPKLVKYITPWSPILSIVIIVMIVGGIIGASKAAIVEHFGVLMLAVLLLHAGGFLLGYGAAWLIGLKEADRRTLCIEVGMQNSGLGSGLAKTPKFAAQFENPAMAALAPVPCAISALYHCLIGSFLAALWRSSRRSEDQLKPNA